MFKNLKKHSEGSTLSQSKGFTIIEVLIVLAIAGLILLIVFLAVPALQRNSRNTQRGNDASRALGASQEVLNNNNGDLDELDSTALRAAIGKPAFYVDTDISVVDAPGATPTNPTTEDTLVIYKGSKCSTATAGHAVTGSTRQLAAVWTAEDEVKRCQDS